MQQPKRQGAGSKFTATIWLRLAAVSQPLHFLSQFLVDSLSMKQRHTGFSGLTFAQILAALGADVVKLDGATASHAQTGGGGTSRPLKA